MQVLQTFNLVAVMVNSYIPSPKVNIELENSTYLRITYREFDKDNFSRFYKFHKDVLWNGILKVDKWGVIEVLLEKKKEENWEPIVGVPITAFYQGLKKIQLPDFYTCKVINTKLLTPNYKYVQLLIDDRNAYSHMGAGEMVDVKQTVNGEEMLLPFPSVPMMPIENFSFPNPVPGEWMNVVYPINLIVNWHEQRKLNKWLFDRKVGDKVIVGNPKCNFTAHLMTQCRHIYMAANGIGVAPLLSTLLWVLQTTNETEVYLGVFENRLNDTFWRNEIEGIKRITKRFHVTYVIKEHLDHSQLVDAKSLRAAFPFRKAYAPYTFFCIAGYEEFANEVYKFANTSMNLPSFRIHDFKEIHQMGKPDIKKQVPIYYDSDLPIGETTSLARRLKKVMSTGEKKPPLSKEKESEGLMGEFNSKELNVIDRYRLDTSHPLTAGPMKTTSE